MWPVFCICQQILKIGEFYFIRALRLLPFKSRCQESALKNSTGGKGLFSKCSWQNQVSPCRRVAFHPFPHPAQTSIHNEPDTWCVRIGKFLSQSQHRKQPQVGCMKLKTGAQKQISGQSAGGLVSMIHKGAAEIKKQSFRSSSGSEICTAFRGRNAKGRYVFLEVFNIFTHQRNAK